MVVANRTVQNVTKLIENLAKAFRLPGLAKKILKFYAVCLVFKWYYTADDRLRAPLLDCVQAGIIRVSCARRTSLGFACHSSGFGIF
jgi:ferredoxin-like protein FixX